MKNLDLGLNIFLMKNLHTNFLLININSAYSNQNIVYLDIQFIIDNSEIGKFYKSKIEENIEKIKLGLLVQENAIKEKDKIILDQKNILKESEMSKKIELNNLVKKYQIERNKYNEILLNEKRKYTSNILKILNPLITSYVEENNIKIVIEKNNFDIGIKNLDITNQLLLKLNKHVKEKNIINEN